MERLVVLLTSLLLLPRALDAEVHLCSNVWTNVDCGETSSPAETPGDEMRTVKRKIVESLERFANRVAADVGHVDFEAQGVRDFCLGEETSLEECRARALKASKSLLAAYQSLSRIRQRDIELDQRLDEIRLRSEKIVSARRKKSRNKG